MLTKRMRMVSPIAYDRRSVNGDAFPLIVNQNTDSMSGTALPAPDCGDGSQRLNTKARSRSEGKVPRWSTIRAPPSWASTGARESGSAEDVSRADLAQ